MRARSAEEGADVPGGRAGAQDVAGQGTDRGREDVAGEGSLVRGLREGPYHHPFGMLRRAGVRRIGCGDHHGHREGRGAQGDSVGGGRRVRLHGRCEPRGPQVRPRSAGLRLVGERPHRARRDLRLVSHPGVDGRDAEHPRIEAPAGDIGPFRHVRHDPGAEGRRFQDRRD